jgi:hypothetical protein
VVVEHRKHHLQKQKTEEDLYWQLPWHLLQFAWLVNVAIQHDDGQWLRQQLYLNGQNEKMLMNFQFWEEGPSWMQVEESPLHVVFWQPVDVPLLQENEGVQHLLFPFSLTCWSCCRKVLIVLAV